VEHFLTSCVTSLSLSHVSSRENVRHWGWGGEDSRHLSQTKTYCSVYSRFYTTTARWADMPGPFLDNGLVHTVLLLYIRFLIMQQLDYNSGRAVFSTWFVPRGNKRDEVWRLISFLCEGGFEYLHRSPASRRRRRKGNPVSGGITKPPCSWGL
jgi:hypothetical protein